MACDMMISLYNLRFKPLNICFLLHINSGLPLYCQIADSSKFIGPFMANCQMYCSCNFLLLPSLILEELWYSYVTIQWYIP